MSNGFIIGRSPSLLNGESVVAIATGVHTPTSNSKTGRMIQTWIIPENVKPTAAVKAGLDQATCGTCPLAGGKGCYVNPVPLNNVQAKYLKGEYPALDIAKMHDDLYWQSLRIGSYGEATALPFEVWEPLLNTVRYWTGYTHQWRTCDRRWQRYLMASVESLEDAAIAQEMGWKTFRIGLAPTRGEIQCPNTLDKSIQCRDCRLCNGSQSKTNVVCPPHGLDFKIERVNQLIKEKANAK